MTLQLGTSTNDGSEEPGLGRRNRYPPTASPLGAFAERHGFSPREFEVLIQVVRGLTDQQIGQELSLSYGTVRTHIERAARKVGVRGRTAILAAALRYIEERAAHGDPTT